MTNYEPGARYGMRLSWVKQFRHVGAICALAALNPNCFLAYRLATADSKLREISIHDEVRRYILHVPVSYTKTKPTALFVVLHGGGGNGRNAEEMTGFTEKSEKEGFLVLYPYGTGRFDTRFLTWNAGNCCGRALDLQKNDVEFIRQLILFVKNAYNVDENRIYATGMSNGGMMAYRLGCELSELISGIAPVAGAMNVDCKPARPVSVIAFHGKADKHVRYEGGKPDASVDTHARVDKSVADAAAFWAGQNKCGSTPARTDVKGRVKRDAYECSDAGLEVVSIEGEGHTWPGGKKGYFGADEPATEISATDVMWEFFQTHPRKRP